MSVPKKIEGTRQILRDVFTFAPSMSIKVIAAIAIGGILDGAGILLFLPFLTAFSVSGSSTSTLPSSVAAWVPQDMSATQLLLLTCGAFLVLMTIRALVAKARDTLNFTLALIFVDQLRVSLLRRLAYAPWQSLTQLKQADIENALITEIDRIKSATLLLGFSLVDIALIVSHSAIIVFLSPDLGLLCLGLVCVTIFFFQTTLRSSHFLGTDMTIKGSNIHKVTSDLLLNLKAAKGQNLETGYLKFFQDAVGAAQDTQLQFKSHELRSGLFLQVAMAAVVVLIFLFGTLVLKNDVANVILIVIALSRLTPTVFRLNRHAQTFSHMIPAYENIQSLMTQFPERPLEKSLHPAVVWDDAAPPLVFDNVTFGFADSKNMLENISFEARTSEFIGILGPSGTGKSTLLDLILGLYQPRKGQVRQYGVVSDERSSNAFRDRCSYLPQESFLLNMTIRENLLWSRPDASEQDIEQVLRAAGAVGFVSEFEHGLETRVGDRGSGISGGQRQRICLAQALLRRPDILLLDEALGANSEAVLREILPSLRRFNPQMILIYVTHRLSDLAEMDRIFLLEDGNLRAIKYQDIPQNSMVRLRPHEGDKTADHEQAEK